MPFGGCRQEDRLRAESDSWPGTVGERIREHLSKRLENALDEEPAKCERLRKGRQTIPSFGDWPAELTESNT
jgi:hypothetical protein